MTTPKPHFLNLVGDCINQGRAIRFPLFRFESAEAGPGAAPEPMQFAEHRGFIARNCRLAAVGVTVFAVSLAVFLD
jgi:hypothetical protein